ncbi:MAG: P-type conjugative transfer protein TrbG [Sphingomonas sp.]|uniref:P-type conjugative transfer protein TrbG n=1 Tax=Sphingomonas sp. TaxID=28214 RepID=UPI001AFDD934|nr:P-type conjugative transfer protein TrbG [Sphingomonas sp.]MBO9623915.1 P-type conjugative transfer protein TrbG [Sphingomonas sp.]
MNHQLLAATLVAVAALPLFPSIASAQGGSASGSGRSSQGLATIRTANRQATAEPRGSAFVNGAAVHAFSEGTIYRVYTAPERVTDIVLQPGETLVAVASGDTARWVIGDTTSGTGADRRAHVLVKPFAVGLNTNLVITTDRRTYHVALSSTSGPAMAALSWSYPQDELLAIRRAREAAEAAAPVAAGLEVERLNFGYEISGDRPPWRPLRAFDDGQQTFIEFAPSLGVGEAPPLFLVGEKGEAQLVNYRLRGRYYVVDRLFDVAELRLGAKRQHVVRISRMAAARGRRSS